MKMLRGHKGSVLTVAADFVSGRALTSSSDETVKSWDLTTGQQLQTLQVASPVYCLAADFRLGRALSGETNGSLNHWNLQTGEILKTYSNDDSIYCVAADFTGQIAVTGVGETLTCWNLETGKKLWKLSAGQVLCVAAQF